jgi:hypothetical protein
MQCLADEIEAVLIVCNGLLISWVTEPTIRMQHAFQPGVADLHNVSQ